MKKRLLWTFAAGICTFGVSAYAHHSFPATYLMDEEASLEGELAAFMYRNPHSVIHVSVKDEAGKTTRWAVEWGAASFLQGQGITRTTFKPGDPVIITGHPARDPGDNRLHLQSIERLSDGLKWPTNPEDADFD